MIQTVSHLKVFFLWSDLNGDRKYYASYQGKEATE